MTKKNEMQPGSGQALVKVDSDIVALTSDGSAELKQIIRDNFGNTPIGLRDLDKIVMPGAGGTTWDLPALVEGEDNSTKRLEVVIIGWSDKRAFWHESFDDTGKSLPDCKSNDGMVGKGKPNDFTNEKEQTLFNEGKAGKTVQVEGGGWRCDTCVHNQFGTALKGNGKACQEKRFILVLFKDAMIPALLRVPVTSIAPLKDYFKRLASQRKSYLGVVTGLSLKKIEAQKPYSVIVPQAIRYLTPEETEQVRSYRIPFAAALDAEDSVDSGYTEKDVSEETLGDMPQFTGKAEDNTGDPF